MKQANIGKPLTRVDGIIKVTGRAQYAADHHLPNLAHGVIVSSTVARGRITALDVAAARNADGVIAVISHCNAPRLPYQSHKSLLDPAGERLHVLQDDLVRFNGQPIAIVVAETLEQAEYAASLARAEYAVETSSLDFLGGLEHAIVPEISRAPNSTFPAETSRGKPGAAWEDSAVKVDAEYLIPRQQHNPMEPHATMAQWEGDRLTVWDKTQWVANVRNELAAVFGLPPENVRVLSPFVGGAFGTTLRAWSHATVAAIAAKYVERPVKLVLSRRQMYFETGYRPETWQRVKLSAVRDGRLTAIIHRAVAETSRHEQYVERVIDSSRFLYSCPNVATAYGILPLDVHTPVYMGLRAPPAESSLWNARWMN